MTRIVVAVLIAVGLAVPAAGQDGGIGDRVIRAIQAARRDAGVPALARRADLDAVARERARQLASLPQARRLVEGRPIGKDLQRGDIPFRRVSLHLDFNRGYPDPAAGFVKSWSSYEASWTSARSGDFDAVGIGTARGADGWIVLAAILLEEEHSPPVPPLPADVEARTVEAINEARTARGLVALEVNTILVEVARAHCRDMIRRGYFDHEALDGITAQDRLRRRGLEFKRVGENLHRNAGFDDPVGTAVRAWLQSDEHRRLLLMPEFRETGVGVAVDGTGTVFFTQLFLEPPERPCEGCTE